MNEYRRFLDKLKNRRERILDGKINSIPLPFPRFKRWWPGIEKKRYTIITANQKVGKSKLADYLYVYSPLLYIMDNPDQIRYEVTYFTLEMGEEEKFNEFLSFLLFYLDKIRITPTDLKSTDVTKPVPQEILDLLESEKYLKYIEVYRNMVTYIEDIKNPTGINKYCRDRALDSANGKLIYKKGQINDEFGNLKEISRIDHYVPTDPEKYSVIIIDNYSNLTSESGLNKMQTIEKMSKYAVILRNQFEYIIVGIQHQAQAQEGIENLKMNRLKPTPDGLADCKTTIRDANNGIGLFSPFKHGIKDYEGYDIIKFKNYIRFMEIMEDRDNGGAGNMCPLFFDGAVSTFFELPLPTDKKQIEQVYKYIESLNKEQQWENQQQFQEVAGMVKLLQQ